MSRSDQMKAEAERRACPRCLRRYALDTDALFWPPVTTCRWCDYTVTDTAAPRSPEQHSPGAHNLRVMR